MGKMGSQAISWGSSVPYKILLCHSHVMECRLSQNSIYRCIYLYLWLHLTKASNTPTFAIEVMATFGHHIHPTFGCIHHSGVFRIYTRGVGGSSFIYFPSLRITQK